MLVILCTANSRSTRSKGILAQSDLCGDTGETPALMAGTQRYLGEQKTQRFAVMVLTCKELKSSREAVKTYTAQSAFLLVSCLNISPLFA